MNYDGISTNSKFHCPFVILPFMFQRCRENPFTSAVYSEVRWTLGSILVGWLGCLDVTVYFGFLCLTCHILICVDPDTIPYNSWSWKDHDHIIEIIWFTFKVSHYLVEIHVKHLQYHRFQQIYCLRELLPRLFRRLTLRFVGIFLALAPTECKRNFLSIDVPCFTAGWLCSIWGIPLWSDLLVVPERKMASNTKSWLIWSSLIHRSLLG